MIEKLINYQLIIFKKDIKGLIQLPSKEDIFNKINELIDNANRDERLTAALEIEEQEFTPQQYQELEKAAGKEDLYCTKCGDNEK